MSRRKQAPPDPAAAASNQVGTYIPKRGSSELGSTCDWEPGCDTPATNKISGSLVGEFCDVHAKEISVTWQGKLIVKRLRV